MISTGRAGHLGEDLIAEVDEDDVEASNPRARTVSATDRLDLVRDQHGVVGGELDHCAAGQPVGARRNLGVDIGTGGAVVAEHSAAAIVGHIQESVWAKRQT